MFGLFKRTRLQNWETELLEETIKKLPSEYLYLINPINEGLFRNVLLNASDIPGYVSFGFNYEIYKKYAREELESFKLSGIKVFDKKTSSFLSYEIYTSSGVINGYSLISGKKINLDLDKIDTTRFYKERIGGDDYKRIEHILDEDERKILSPSEVYSVILDNNEYFHIKDLDDGNFIGIDIEKEVYKITHNPLEIKKISLPLKEVLKSSL
ncbi:conserved hypothetical protein [Tenacibaculum maritimum]|uniref:hypothetical protein n=1 Tax=Tenacibaculum maritimum TaxID=107401 RepID=UPI0012E62D13|nr:hypothetical protein [Tenacibaculum maritimum]CAA0211152.1 conserved hypothetical protein [Tenacibaculum maritimum]CAA0227200.1 conserved hypothetical protein [Tenacibaculum maritimum]